MNSFIVNAVGVGYRKVAKPLLFLRDPELVHVHATALGEWLGRSATARRALAGVFSFQDSPKNSSSGSGFLKQNVLGIDFANPIGLAAGFDYEARLTQILPAMGFGFGTVGTLTNQPYGGNPRPMLGRLPRSRSLMVNKGFKNDGVAATLARLGEKLQDPVRSGVASAFAYPVGVSIGKTNTADLATQAEAIADVVAGFRAAEASGVPFAYYELNISCPNLVGLVEFYKPKHLEELLVALEEIFSRDVRSADVRRARPVFVKMPISKTDEEVRAMMDVIVCHPFIKAVIFGNLQRDRNNPALVPEEAARWSVGNFSGVPCRDRSDELIRLVYREYGAKIRVIGCGGTFSAEDAYRKIKLGASLVQLITGLIFQGPQLVAQINRDLARMLARDGYRSIAEAVGAEA
jgi:dihydroorotate dehydrogenase